MAASPISLAFIFLFFFAVIERSQSQSQSVDFIYNGFNYSTNSYPELKREGASIIKPSGALRLTNRTTNVTGHAFYPDPIKMLHTSLSTRTLSSFNTSFVFSIVPPADSGSGGYGLAFVISPSPQFPGAANGHYLGIFNSSTDDKSSNHIFVVEFDTVNGFKGDADTKGNHVGININSMSSVASKPAYYYYKDGTNATEELELEDGKPVRAWIEYDGVKSEVKVYTVLHHEWN
ncbi:hypothetical protein L1049_008938 [Liquidambar formosana]|uniref:Legume lectin domain-containing protein n=1 Tax=Liquidambar formosana TaxID=63359 RepID=A0AAP0SA71_LIQFO